MPLVPSYYPVSPLQVPAALTKPTLRFRFQVLAVLFSLFLFLILYVGLLALSAWALYWSITVSMGTFFLVKLILIFFSGLLFIYLLKGLFKRDRAEKSLRVEIKPSEHPRLFDFIKQLCEETHAPLPHRVYVSPEVNAAVFYHESFLSLFLPTPKNLLLGLGLVNVLNLSEFKAVLAHEFGHFAQRSMKLNAYVYKANRIISDIVFGRDWLDDFLIRVKYLDNWLVLPIWGLVGLLWVVRKLLGFLFQSINGLSSGLSRQMEFNADLVAVGVAGSSAAVHALAKTVIASECWDQALNDLRAAANHHLYTKDLFFHQNHAVPYLRNLKQNPDWGELATPHDDAGTGNLFQPENHAVPLMWATHPTNYDREKNAKRHFVACPLDERSPWVLFDQAGRLREKVTRRFYRVGWRIPKQADCRGPEEVHAFIEEEHAESTYGKRYHSIYDNRFISFDDISGLVVKAGLEKPDLKELTLQHSQLFAEDLRVWTEDHLARLQEHHVLRGFQDEPAKSKRGGLDFRGRRYEPKIAGRLLKKVESELKEDQQWLEDFDKRVFHVHYQLARLQGEPLTQDLVNRYRFHLLIQQFVGQLGIQQGTLNTVLAMIASQRELTANQYCAAREAFQQTHASLAQILSQSRLLEMPALGNFKKGEHLGPFLLEQPLIYELLGETSGLTGKWINRLVEQVGEVLDKLQRLRAKSWGGILALQEGISGRAGL